MCVSMRKRFWDTRQLRILMLRMNGSRAQVKKYFGIIVEYYKMNTWSHTFMLSGAGGTSGDIWQEGAGSTFN